MPGIVCPAGQRFYEPDYVEIVKATDPLAYWPLGERFGAIGYDVTGNEFNDAITGATLGQPGIGDGLTSMLFDGVNDWGVLPATIYPAFNGLEGSLASWIRMRNAGIWTDGNAHRVFVFMVGAAVEFAILEKSNANNTLQLQFQAGGVFRNVSSVAAGGITDWIHFGCSWSDSGDQIFLYINGVEIGPTINIGTWVGVPTRADYGSTGLRWNGWLEHGALWTRALPLAEFQHLYRVRWTR